MNSTSLTLAGAFAALLGMTAPALAQKSAAGPLAVFISVDMEGVAGVVTADLAIEYKKPVPVDAEISVEGWQEEVKGRNRFRVGEIRDAHGTLLARGKGRFVVVDNGRKS